MRLLRATWADMNKRLDRCGDDAPETAPAWGFRSQEKGFRSIVSFGSVAMGLPAIACTHMQSALGQVASRCATRFCVWAL